MFLSGRRRASRRVFINSALVAAAMGQGAAGAHASAPTEAEIRTMVSAAIAEHSRTSLLLGAQRAANAGGLVLGPTTNAGEPIHVAGRIQFRGTYNRRQRTTGARNESGFSLRRVRLTISNQVYDHLGYYLQVTASRSTGQVSAEDYYITSRLSNVWSLQFGRFRPPFLREQLISSKRQLAVERSIVSSALGQGRGIGLRLFATTDSFRFYISIVDRGGDLGGLERWATAVRIEKLIAGRWSMVRHSSADAQGRTAILIGGGSSYQFEQRQDGKPQRTRFRWTGDVTLKRGRLVAFVAAMGEHASRSTFGPSFDRYGFVAQAGWRTSDEWEFFGRAEGGHADESAADLFVLTTGVNYYVRGNRGAKWSTDVGFAFTEVGGFWSTTGAGYLTDQKRQDGQLVVRTQFQLVF